MNQRSLLSRLEPHGQEHLAAFWDTLQQEEQDRLAAQIESLDLELIQRVFLAGGDRDTDWAQLAARAQSPPAFRLGDRREQPTDEQARRCGVDVLRGGKVGVILVAGGQGTRLGFPHPKGMFPLGPVSHRSLFQILIELLLATGRRYGVRIPLYLMTSDATHDQTLQFLDRHQNFGLPADDLRVFRQGRMPAVDAKTGKILLAEPGALFVAPDGHGGMLAALHRSGCYEHARRRGVEHFFYGQIDNPLIQLCDPRLIGFHVLAGSEMTTQVVAKSGPFDRVGNVALIDGRLQIIEYSDLPAKDAEDRHPDGELRLWAGSIAVHVFEAAFLGRMAEMSDRLPLHRAQKKVDYVDSDGRLVRPTEPNAIKFERFIFDLLPWARRPIVVEAAREDAFAAVKNDESQPEETPSTARAAMVAQHAGWLRDAGAIVEEGVQVEINPFWAQDAEEVAARVERGWRVAEDVYLCDEARGTETGKRD